jgi:hypothetical protein
MHSKLQEDAMPDGILRRPPRQATACLGRSPFATCNGGVPPTGVGS